MMNLLGILYSKSERRDFSAHEVTVDTIQFVLVVATLNLWHFFTYVYYYSNILLTSSTKYKSVNLFISLIFGKPLLYFYEEHADRTRIVLS